ncbi:Restriction endonuclease Mrr (Mrr) [Commensalibacter communis]|uniref:Restriction endonuclease Mrr (Mrr) n=1 Tax=Commensalibacter communis TaxID=2972786 RepID=A0A9W4TPV2_9PROT|nr:restriction endonuclease [Commensalibacter communis]CAI3949335.1 Restriction endonuclease Mrr (Mrr) [Commensalibacter communis]CAI3961503.1 Restriction endonuclease Mrr (Mrr) [Commensalibacter communis]CAI3961606.1 Restriction endonuclease Mrr (Mrr) [Commensalibacter communis]CAI3962050.1 Restriction endonuclease Mrr (Mrr) [Commensalibacter communis]
MAINITPRLIDLTYEALLKSYWRKEALKKFLKSSNISSTFIATWSDDETKRIFLDRLFNGLQQTAKGKAVISHMAHSLSEQSSFPDLRGPWEDSILKIQAAHKAVQELKSYLKQLNEQVTSEKERLEIQKQARIEKERIQRSQTDKHKLQQGFEALQSQIGTQEGGYAFEKWFYQLLDFCEIQSKRPYITSGRQIDGSLTHEGTTYLLELKFTKNLSGVQEIDSLKAKVSKMADNTMGIMISVSGYTQIAISEASGSKTTILIMDVNHLYLFFSGVMSFKEIISRIRRHASQTGQAYLSVNEFNH